MGAPHKQGHTNTWVQCMYTYIDSVVMVTNVYLMTLVLKETQPYFVL